jgi:hypothetical protein
MGVRQIADHAALVIKSTTFDQLLLWWATRRFTTCCTPSFVHRCPERLTHGNYNDCSAGNNPGSGSINGGMVKVDANNNVNNCWSMGQSSGSAVNFVWVQWTVDEWYDDWTGNGGNQPTMHRVWVK